MSDEYYQTLGISKTATKDEISSAYRKLARKYHPDLNQDNPKVAREQFQKVQEAYDVLSNEEKRKMYDQFGVSPDQMGNGGGQGQSRWSFGGGGNPGRSGNFNFNNIEEIMAMFGGGFAGKGMSPDDFVNAGRRQSQGQDITQNLSIPFTLAINGGKIDIKLRRRSDGDEEAIAVTIPPGIEEGKKMRLPGLGYQGRSGGKSGSLLLTIHIEDHQYFTRQGNNLYVRVPVSLKEAVLGTKIDIPTPKGSVSLSIPAGSTSGTKLRMKNYGVPSQNGTPAGDLFAELVVTLPKKWSEADKKSIEGLTSEPDKLRNDLCWDLR